MLPSPRIFWLLVGLSLWRLMVLSPHATTAETLAQVYMLAGQAMHPLCVTPDSSFSLFPRRFFYVH